MIVGSYFKRLHISKVVHCGEAAYLIYFAGIKIREQNQRVHNFTQIVLHDKPRWVTEVVPSFDTVMISFNPLEVDQYNFFKWLSQLEYSEYSSQTSNHHTIKVNYDRSKKYDLANVAQSINRSINDVVSMHTASTYTAYAVGFLPGFAYLGDTHQSMQLPRLSKPRSKVPAGAVAIADSYTAVYPAESPGGWHLIGTLADNQSTMLELDIKAGDTVAFMDCDIDN
jgi:KipI family sensor histidine kinase inhibitor